MTRKWQTFKGEEKSKRNVSLDILKGFCLATENERDRDTMTSAKSRFGFFFTSVIKCASEAILICMIFLHRIIFQLISSRSFFFCLTAITTFSIGWYYYLGEFMASEATCINDAKFSYRDEQHLIWSRNLHSVPHKVVFYNRDLHYCFAQLAKRY